MSYSSIQVLPDGDLLIKSGSDLSNNIGSISDFLKSKDYLFHQKEQSDLRDIKIKKILE